MYKKENTMNETTILDRLKKQIVYNILAAASI